MKTRVQLDFKLVAEDVNRRFARQDDPGHSFALAVAEGRIGLGIAAC
jgi:hypothetical protein